MRQLRQLWQAEEDLDPLLSNEDRLAPTHQDEGVIIGMLADEASKVLLVDVGVDVGSIAALVDVLVAIAAVEPLEVT